MTEHVASALPITLIYNLNRLGQSGDEIIFSANEAERETLARHAEILEVSKFDAKVVLRRISPNRFGLSFHLAAEVFQACVVTLEPVVARITRDFERELHFTPSLNRMEKDVTVTLEDDDAPEEIGSPQYDLAVPLIEEFVLAIDPYPRAPGAEFRPPAEAGAAVESPFAVLKGLKSDQESTK